MHIQVPLYVPPGHSLKEIIGPYHPSCPHDHDSDLCDVDSLFVQCEYIIPRVWLRSLTDEEEASYPGRQLVVVRWHPAFTELVARAKSEFLFPGLSFKEIGLTEPKDNWTINAPPRDQLIEITYYSTKPVDGERAPCCCPFKYPYNTLQPDEDLFNCTNCSFLGMVCWPGGASGLSSFVGRGSYPLLSEASFADHNTVLEVLPPANGVQDASYREDSPPGSAWGGRVILTGGGLGGNRPL